MITTNVPSAERMLRLLIGLALAAWAWFAQPPYHLLLLAGGCCLALTGLVGFCPACALAGRRPAPRR
jgi:hypothetical protein